ncbi:MAG: sigma-54 dependent transcriptional regulator [Salinivirgaceae bacterium]|jgi:formate hydrogenlyase transcriptional activator|nr:sigma-54 dependent transcriptional regulator [Salinivirgaceae bacterium]
MKKILYVDDEKNNLLTFELTMQKWFEVYTTTKPEEAAKIISKHHIQTLVTDQRMPKISGLELAAQIIKAFPWLSIIMVTAYSDPEIIIDAVNQGGIFRYMPKPWDYKDLQQSIVNAIEATELREKNINLVADLQKKNTELEKSNAEIAQLKKQIEKENIQLKLIHKETQATHKHIVTQSPALQSVLGQLLQVSNTDTTILLLGETGTGKELFANAIHEQSNRSENVMVKVNCAAIPENLVESELFGHEKGAFTSADKQKIGKFELAHNGTLFLDEIGELPLNIQSKLLRVLQEGEFERVGGNMSIKTNFRLVAATNRNLEEAIANKEFRSDLFFRLNIVPITIPPLREHKEDIPLLAHHFLDKFNKEKGKIVSIVPPEVMDQFWKYAWPGNIRELQNIVERAHVLSTGNTLEINNWLKTIDNKPANPSNLVTLREHERNYILAVVRQTKWRIRGKGGAAEILDIHPSTLESRMKKLNIERPV